MKQASMLKMCQTTSLLVKSEEKTVQIVLPTSEVGKYLRNVHDSNGHAGYDICKSRLRNFWWPGLAEDLKNYVRSCSICASRKGRYGQRAPQIGVCEKGLKPWEIIFIDFIQLPPVNGIKFCMTLIDSFSRFLRVYPSRGCAAEDACKALKKFIIEFGTVPRCVHSDRGSHFVSSTFTELCKELQIFNKLHVAFRPQSSGLVERVHRSLKNSLYITAHQLGVNWTQILDRVVLSINSNVHSATKVSPFKVIYGKEAELGMISFNQLTSKNAKSYSNEMANQMSVIHKTVRLCNAEVDRRAKAKQLQMDSTDYQQGDKVMVWREISRKKIAKGFDWIPGTIITVYDYVVEVELNGKRDLVSLHHVRKVPVRSEKLNYDDVDFDEIVIVSPDATFGGGDDGPLLALPPRRPVENSVKKENVAGAGMDTISNEKTEYKQELDAKVAKPESAKVDVSNESENDEHFDTAIESEADENSNNEELDLSIDNIQIGKPSSSSTPHVTRNDGERGNTDEEESEAKQSRYGREYKKKVIFDPST